MKYTHGAQTVETYSGKKILKSGAVGSTNVEEIKWLISTLVTNSKAWDSWGYIVDISHMSPVTPDVGKELVNLHKELAASGCKAMAFVEYGAFVTAAQAKQHQKNSNTGIYEGHFKTEEDAIKWIEDTLK